MELQKLLNELTGENTGKVNSALDDRIRRIETLTTGNFVGKVYNLKDIQKIISSMKSEEEKWKVILFGSGSKSKKSPKEWAIEVEKTLQKMDDSEIEGAIPESNPDGKNLNDNQKIVYDFIDELEARFQKIAIGDYESLFRSKSRKINTYGDEEEESEDSDYSETESAIELAKKKIRNIIPIKVKAFGEEYLGIIRPGSSGGSNGIITWQKIADSFSTKMDHYEEKYDSLKPEQKAEYDLLSKDFANAKKLPKSLPLIQRNSSGTELKVHATQEIKSLKERGLIEYDDDPNSMAKIGDIIVNVIKDSGKSFAGEETKKLSKEQISQFLGLTNSENDPRIYDVPTWAISSSGFWSEIEKFF